MWLHDVVDSDDVVLHQVYGPSAWWWEVEELVRKLFLSAVVVLIESGSPLQVRVVGAVTVHSHRTVAIVITVGLKRRHAALLWRSQITLAVLVCGWAHVLHAMYKPWGAGTVMYALQHGSLFVTSFVFLMVRAVACDRRCCRCWRRVFVTRTQAARCLL